MRKRLLALAAVLASCGIVWASAAQAQTTTTPETLPPTTTPTTKKPLPTTSTPGATTPTTDVIPGTTAKPTTTLKKTTTTRRSGTTIVGAVTTTIFSDTTTSIDTSTTSTSIETTTTTRTPRTTIAAESSDDESNNSLLLFAALGLGAVAGIGLIGWRLISRSSPGADGPYLILDDEPTIVAGSGLLTDEPTSGPGGDPFIAPIALVTPVDTKPKQGKKQKPPRAVYKRKPKTPEQLSDEKFSAVVNPVAAEAAPLPVFEPEAAPPPPVYEAPSPPEPPKPEPPKPEPPKPEPPRPAPRPVVVPEIEDIDLAAPMDLAPEEVSMDIDWNDPEP